MCERFGWSPVIACTGEDEYGSLHVLVVAFCWAESGTQYRGESVAVAVEPIGTVPGISQSSGTQFRIVGFEAVRGL